MSPRPARPVSRRRFLARQRRGGRCRAARRVRRRRRRRRRRDDHARRRGDLVARAVLRRAPDAGGRQRGPGPVRRRPMPRACSRSTTPRRRSPSRSSAPDGRGRGRADRGARATPRACRARYFPLRFTVERPGHLHRPHGGRRRGARDGDPGRRAGDVQVIQAGRRAAGHRDAHRRRRPGRRPDLHQRPGVPAARRHRGRRARAPAGRSRCSCPRPRSARSRSAVRCSTCSSAVADDHPDVGFLHAEVYAHPHEELDAKAPVVDELGLTFEPCLVLVGSRRQGRRAARHDLRRGRGRRGAGPTDLTTAGNVRRRGRSGGGTHRSSPGLHVHVDDDPLARGRPARRRARRPTSARPRRRPTTSLDDAGRRSRRSTADAIAAGRSARATGWPRPSASSSAPLDRAAARRSASASPPSGTGVAVHPTRRARASRRGRSRPASGWPRPRSGSSRTRRGRGGGSGRAERAGRGHVTAASSARARSSTNRPASDGASVSLGVARARRYEEDTSESTSLLQQMAAATDEAFGARRATEARSDLLAAPAGAARSRRGGRAGGRARVARPGRRRSASRTSRRVVRRFDPQHQDAREVAQDAVGVRAASTLARSARPQRWDEAWRSRSGFDGPRSSSDDAMGRRGWPTG